MMWDLPIAVEIDGETHAIRNKCDYRMVLDVICALNDEELSQDDRVRCALCIFYEEPEKLSNLDEAVKHMFGIIGGGESEEEKSERKPKLMDWEHDFKLLVPPINRVLGFEIRSVEYLHWYSFLSGYQEIGECTFQTVVSIRQKRLKGKKLEKWEREFYSEHKKMVDLPRKMTADDTEWLNSEW